MHQMYVYNFFSSNLWKYNFCQKKKKKHDHIIVKKKNEFTQELVYLVVF